MALNVFALLWFIRRLDRNADTAVQRWLLAQGEGSLDEIATGTGLRPATVRLALARMIGFRTVTADDDRSPVVYRLTG